MLNMLRMDVRRLTRSKSFYLCLCILALLIMICAISQNDAQISKGFTNELDTGHVIGVFTALDCLITTPEALLSGLGKTYIGLIFGIFLVLFVCEEYQCGYIKNSCMMYQNRNAIILNKFMVALFLSCFLVVFSAICVTLFGFLFIKQFHIGDMGVLLSYMGVLAIVLTAYHSLLICISTLSHQKTLGIVIVFLLSSAFIFMIIDPILINFHLLNIKSYLITGMMSSLPMKFDAVISVRILVMSMIYMITYTALSIVIIRRKDL